MKITDIKTNLGFSLIMAAALVVPVANAQLTPPVDSLEGVNIIGLGIGSAPDYMGSSKNKGAAAPIFRYQLQGSERYFLLLGPQATFNILDDANWRFGPMANFRPGRGDDVENATVKRMVGINNTTELGVFLGYRMKLSEARMHQINFTADVAGGSNGTVGNLRMMYWLPISQGTIINIGVGTTIASSKWMETYFGVTKPSDIALFPSLNGQPFNAGSGVKGVNIPFGVTYFLNREWLLTGGGRYEKLTNDAKDSPVTAVRGDSNQWLFGAALSYLW